MGDSEPYGSRQPGKPSLCQVRESHSARKEAGQGLAGGRAALSGCWNEVAWGPCSSFIPVGTLTRPDHRPGVGVVKGAAGGEGQPIIFLFCG